MSQNKIDLTAFPDLLRHAKDTGPLRKQRPIYQDFLPPCSHACPVGEKLQAWLARAMAGQYEQAWKKLIDDNPMPAILGRVCYHPCEDSCNRTHLDEPVFIHAVERFL